MVAENMTAWAAKRACFLENEDHFEGAEFDFSFAWLDGKCPCVVVTFLSK